MKRIAALVCCLLASSPALVAQTWEKVLVPLVIEEEVAGAFGSRWQSELIGRNDADVRVEVDTRVGGIPHATPAEPHTTFKYYFFPAEQGSASLLWISTPHNEMVTFNLRVRDISRQAQTWGTEIPVVREREFFQNRILSLLNVPTDSRFRQTLRIYDVDTEEVNSIRLRIYNQETDALLVDQVQQFAFPPGPRGHTIPGRIQINNLADAYPAIRGAERVRVEITPATPQLRFWAFVSITNNETQHVTTITPQ